MKTHPRLAALTPPPPSEMADELLMSSSHLILDHYSATQGRRVLKLMQSDPTALLTEMWRAMRNLNLTTRTMAVEQGRKEPPGPELVRSLRPEAYQSIYPAVETPEPDEMTRAQRRKLDDWLESLAHNPAEMTILFLHGKESKPGGTKPTYLAKHGFTVLNPKLPDDDFDEAVRIAQGEFDWHKPAVVVGSSRGGAVAMNINSGKAGLVLLCSAWKKWGTAKAVKQRTTILHSKEDDIVPFADSVELIANSGYPAPTLIEIGCDHRLSTRDALKALLIAVRAESIPSNATRVCATDLQMLVFIERELLRGDLNVERRAELCEARGDIGEAYAHDWLWDEPEMRDHPDNPRREK